MSAYAGLVTFDIKYMYAYNNHVMKYLGIHSFWTERRSE